MSANCCTPTTASESKSKTNLSVKPPPQNECKAKAVQQGPGSGTSSSPSASSNNVACAKVDLLDIVKPKRVKICKYNWSCCPFPKGSIRYPLCSWFASPIYYHQCWRLRPSCCTVKCLGTDERKNLSADNQCGSEVGSRVSTNALHSILSVNDLRAWSLSCEDNRRYFYEQMLRSSTGSGSDSMNDDEGLADTGASAVEARYENLLSKKDDEIERLKRRLLQLEGKNSKSGIGKGSKGPNNQSPSSHRGIDQDGAGGGPGSSGAAGRGVGNGSPHDASRGSDHSRGGSQTTGTDYEPWDADDSGFGDASERGSDASSGRGSDGSGGRGSDGSGGRGSDGSSGRGSDGSGGRNSDGRRGSPGGEDDPDSLRGSDGAGSGSKAGSNSSGRGSDGSDGGDPSRRSAPGSDESDPKKSAGPTDGGGEGATIGKDLVPLGKGGPEDANKNDDDDEGWHIEFALNDDVSVMIDFI